MINLVKYKKDIDTAVGLHVHYFLQERLIFGQKLNVLNNLRILAPNVLKTFINILVSIGCPVVIFHSHKPTGSKNTLYQLAGTKVIQYQIKRKLKQSFTCTAL